MHILSERMRELRKERHMKQNDMAKLLGISMSAYCRYERDEREPTAPIIVALADFYGVTTDYLLGRTEEK